jgi:hypothetical protein
MNMQALMSDSVQFLTSSTTGLFYLGKQGLDSVGLGSWNNGSPYSVGSRLKIKDLKELKGKKIASSGAGGRADAFIRFMLANVGLDPKTDAQIMPLSGGSSVRLAAVLSGNLDATLISTLQGRHAEKLGLTVIAVPLEYMWGINLTRRSLSQKSPAGEELPPWVSEVRLLMADKPRLRHHGAGFENRRPGELGVLVSNRAGGLRPDLFPTEESIVNVLKTMSYEDPAFLSIPPYKFFDLSLIQELKAESR